MPGPDDRRVGGPPPAEHVRHPRRRGILWVLAAVGLVLAAAGYRHFGGDPRAATVAPAGAPVRLARVERRRMALTAHTLGTVIAESTVQVRARVEGMLEKAYFREGDFVRKGQLLFQIDPRPFQVALQQARATLERDQALLRNARRDQRRYQRLFKENSTSVQQLDAAAANADALAATVSMDQAAVSSARLNLTYAQIRSPIDGKTGPLLVQPGNMVSGTPSAALVTIAQLRPVKLSFSLPQSDYARIRAAGPSDPLLATIDPAGARERALSAPVDFSSNAIDTQSGTIELRATFPNGRLSLLPGQTVDVTVTLGYLRDALVVPRAALNYGADGPYLFVVHAGRATMRPVKVRFDDGQNVAVAGSLAAGEAVVVEGQLRVVPGERIHAMPRAPVRMSPGDRNRGPQYGPDGPGGQR